MSASPGRFDARQSTAPPWKLLPYASITARVADFEYGAPGGLLDVLKKSNRGELLYVVGRNSFGGLFEFDTLMKGVKIWVRWVGTLPSLIGTSRL